MEKIRAVLTFYSKLLIPVATLSFLLGLIGFPISDSYAFPGVGVGFICFTPLIHYFTYEVKNRNEYYFYYNLGLTKVALWIASILIGFAAGLTLILL